MLRKAFMAATVLLLLLLVLITPRFIGVREDISTLPRIILNYEDQEFIIFVTSLSGTYLYRALYLNVTSSGSPEANRTLIEDSHGVEAKLYLNKTTHFRIEAVAKDQRNVHFEVVAEVDAVTTEEGWSFSIQLDEEDPREYSERELSNSPLATLMERRKTP